MRAAGDGADHGQQGGSLQQGAAVQSAHVNILLLRTIRVRMKLARRFDFSMAAR
jgi:hypothetical protein